MTAPVVSSFFPDLPVVLVSHRGPVSFRRDQTGARTASRGAGGLVTALTGLASSLPDAVWVCAAATTEDVAVAREHGLSFPILLQKQWEISRRYAMFATPVAYMIDENGVTEREVVVGSDAIRDVLATL